ncbi:hypothetical protein BO86DRAFT_213472 [Aspergillus japonicus CBS 114.51]|uniref:Secreted protein n=1 Tax=Aspergillus japonicus CBS 114.51 TaxID=1448312 RepID=A0A8T8XAW4_ASPJA|nr:hypothetical protein BO86DRAFT_213472 [Aspergillus japonicus CBS 114.51]RAH85120.1 hypothetical protein BO86DRAFT_213472 [Aspergillus japonicus CBS 114.51]
MLLALFSLLFCVVRIAYGRWVRLFRTHVPHGFMSNHSNKLILMYIWQPLFVVRVAYTWNGSSCYPTFETPQ